MFGFSRKKKCASQVELEQMKQETRPSSDIWNQVASAGDFRMTIEDTFGITGRGTVLTGKIESGELAVGDTVRLNGATYSVQGIEGFRRNLSNAKVGDNVGVLLRGLGRNDAKSGDVITK